MFSRTVSIQEDNACSGSSAGVYMYICLYTGIMFYHAYTFHIQITYAKAQIKPFSGRQPVNYLMPSVLLHRNLARTYIFYERRCILQWMICGASFTNCSRRFHTICHTNGEHVGTKQNEREWWREIPSKALFYLLNHNIFTCVSLLLYVTYVIFFNLCFFENQAHYTIGVLREYNITHNYCHVMLQTYAVAICVHPPRFIRSVFAMCG